MLSKLEQIFTEFDSRACELQQQYADEYHEVYINPKQSTINHRAQIVQQVRAELFGFVKMLVKYRKNNHVLQVGLGHFGSTHYLLSRARSDRYGKIVTIEYNQKFINDYMERESTYNFNTDVFISGDSTNEFTIKQTLLNAPFDTLLIDGNHTYKYVKQDFNNYYPMLNNGGICAFHDTIFEVERYGVKTFVDELRSRFDIKDIVHSTTTGISYFIKNNY